MKTNKLYRIIDTLSPDLIILYGVMLMGIVMSFFGIAGPLIGQLFVVI